MAIGEWEYLRDGRSVGSQGYAMRCGLFFERHLQVIQNNAVRVSVIVCRQAGQVHHHVHRGLRLAKIATARPD